MDHNRIPYHRDQCVGVDHHRIHALTQLHHNRESCETRSQMASPRRWQGGQSPSPPTNTLRSNSRAIKLTVNVPTHARIRFVGSDPRKVLSLSAGPFLFLGGDFISHITPIPFADFPQRKRERRSGAKFTRVTPTQHNMTSKYEPKANEVPNKDPKSDLWTKGIFGRSFRAQPSL